MSGELSLSAVRHDERFTDQAFAAYRQEHGIHEAKRLGDMPLRVVSEIMDKAQKLKSKEQEQ